MSVDGPTRATEGAHSEWAKRPWLAGTVRFVALVLPTAVSFLVTWLITRNWPPQRIGIDPWAWWIALFLLATLTLIAVDRGARRLLPLAALFKLSLVFPDEAPSRFRTAMRTGTTRQLQRRVEEIRLRGIAGADDPETNFAASMLELVAALSVHDRLTRGHCERVRAYTDLVIDELKIPEPDASKLRWAALLHDVGKIHVPSEILAKTTRPSPAEWELLKSHTWQGDRLIEPLKPWLGDWAAVIGSHHERWDGGGYPNGLAGEQIHLGARVVAVVDAYDVMTSTRSYKQPITAEEARAEISRCAGSQFDPRVVRAFLNVGLGRLRFAAGPLAWLANIPGAGSVAPTATPVASGIAPTIAPLATGTTAVLSAIAAIASGGFGGVLRPEAPSELAFEEVTAPGVVMPTTTIELGADPTTTTVVVGDEPAEDVETTMAGKPDEPDVEPAITTVGGGAAQSETTTVPAGTAPPTTSTTSAPGEAPDALSSTAEAGEDQHLVATLRAASDVPVTFTITASPRHAVILGGPVDDIVAPVAGVSSLELRIQPTANWSGTDSLTFAACVGGACDEATVVLEVRARNDAPEITGTSSLNGTEGMAILPLELEVSDADHPIASLSLSAQGLPSGLTLDAGHRIVGTPTTAGTFAATIVVTDPAGAQGTHGVSIAIAAAASQPTLAITEVLYSQTDLESPFSAGTQDEFIEVTNLGASSVDLAGYRLVDFDPNTGTRDTGAFWGSVVDLSLDVTFGPDARGAGSVLAPGQSAVVWIGNPDRTTYTETIAPFGVVYDHAFALRAFDHAPAGALEYVDAGQPWGTLGWAGEDLWLLSPDGSIADFVAWNNGGWIEQQFSGRPGGAAWNQSGENLLAAAPEGLSLSLGTPAVTNGTECWVFTGLRPGSSCADPRTTRDHDSAPGGSRSSSVGRRNYT